MCVMNEVWLISFLYCLLLITNIVWSVYIFTIFELFLLKFLVFGSFQDIYLSNPVSFNEL